MKREKTIKELLNSFTRSNKKRRERIAELAGFKSASEYLKYLRKEDLKAEKQTNEESALDVVISFDTTGSMYPYIKSVREHILSIVDNLFEKVKDLRIGIVAHGDYADIKSDKKVNLFNGDIEGAYYSLFPTSDKKKIIRFIEKNHETSGGDTDEFYELVIKKINEETPWRKNAKKLVILIADSEPHQVGYKCRSYENNIDWFQQAKTAAEKNIQYDTLSCGVSSLWRRTLSEITGGVHMPFSEVNKVQHIVVASTLARYSEKEFLGYTSNTIDSSLSESYKILEKKFIKS